MKKIISLMLVLLMVLASVVSLAETAKTPSACIVVAGTFGDRGFYDSAKAGMEALQADYGTEIGMMECNEDGSLYEAYLFEAAEQYDMVFAVGWQFWDALAADDGVLQAYPDVKFVFIDNGLDGVGDNLMSVVYAQNEGSFLAGYVAAKLSQTGKLGAVGGEDSETINDFIVGYEDGAKYANPDCEVIVRYANGYEDPASGKEMANALYNAGCDIVYAIAGNTGNGVYEAAKETGHFAVGVDSDVKFICPEAIICSMVKQVGQSIYGIVSNPEMFLPGQIWEADMGAGYIGVAYGNEEDGTIEPMHVSAELQAEVENIKQMIISGEIVVASAFAQE